ncbi:MAG TPA: PASTA domain-containing protein [Pyrinomonadaceae bacterium]
MAQRALPSLIGKLATLVVIAFAFLLALVGTIYLSLRSPEVRVPEVVGKTFSDAENALADAGLSVRTRARRFSSEVKPDTVLDQTPHAGDTVKKGQTIAIVLSRAEAKGGESSVGVRKEEEKKAESENASPSSSPEASNANNRNENKPKKPTNKNKNANANNANANSNITAAKNVNSNLNTNLVGNSAGGAEDRAGDETPVVNRNTATPPRNANAPTNAPRNANANGAAAPNANAGRARAATNRNANAGGARGANANRRPPREPLD